MSVNKEFIVDFTEFDPQRVLYSREQIERVIPHRHEMSLLDGVLFEDLERGRYVGFADPKPTDFWVRGHFPQRPLMPGVLICEIAAQLCSFVAIRQKMLATGVIALGGLDEVRFRLPVVPGNRLIMMIETVRFRPNALILIRFQGVVDKQIATEGTLKGVVMPDSSLDRR